MFSNQNNIARPEQHQPTEAHTRDNLYMIIHAHECTVKERENEKSVAQSKPAKHPVCTLPACPPNKLLLQHMIVCDPTAPCNVPECASSRMLIVHWKSCFEADCQLCRLARDIEPPSGRDNGNSRNICTCTRNQVVSQLAARFPPYYDPIAPNALLHSVQLAREIEQDVYNHVDSRHAYMIHMEMIIYGPNQDQYPKDWQRRCSNNFRAIKIRHLMKALMPQLNDHLNDNLTYAKLMENSFFEDANSKPEYEDTINRKVAEINAERLQRQPSPPSSQTSPM